MGIHYSIQPYMEAPLVSCGSDWGVNIYIPPPWICLAMHISGYMLAGNWTVWSHRLSCSWYYFYSSLSWGHILCVVVLPILPDCRCGDPADRQPPANDHPSQCEVSCQGALHLHRCSDGHLLLPGLPHGLSVPLSCLHICQFGKHIRL